MLRLIAVALLLATCGSSAADLPTPPFASEPTGQRIDFTTPIDTATTDLRPRNMLDRFPLPPGETSFTWTPLDGADTYLLVAHEITNLDNVDARLDLTPYTSVEADQAEAEVMLLDPFEDGYAPGLIVQVFAYDGGELIGMSDLWSIQVEQ